MTRGGQKNRLFGIVEGIGNVTQQNPQADKYKRQDIGLILGFLVFSHGLINGFCAQDTDGITAKSLNGHAVSIQPCDNLLCLVQSDTHNNGDEF